MVLTFNDYNFLFESVKDTKTAVMCFGRMNPPTNAHLMVMNAIVDCAKKEHATACLFVSHTQDAKKNPLDYETKIEYLKKLAPKGLKVFDSPARTLIEAAKVLGDMGYKRLIVLCGSDRVKAYQVFEKYKKDMNIDEYEVKVVGKERNELSNDIDGMSASKMRQFVIDGKRDEFIKNSPFSKEDSAKLYMAVRNGLKLK